MQEMEKKRKGEKKRGKKKKERERERMIKEETRPIRPTMRPHDDEMIV